MRAISLHQPWATAIAIGVKSVETREWSTGYRGPLAIHAAITKKWFSWFSMALRSCDQPWPDVGPLFKAAGYEDLNQLPLGKVVAVCNLCDCVPVESVRETITPLERAFGGYDDGRFAWILKDVRPIKEPFDCIGRQSFFQVPDDEIARALGGGL